MNTTNEVPDLTWTQAEWLELVNKEFRDHRRLDEIKVFCLMAFGATKSVSHKTANEIIQKAIGTFGKF